MYFGRFYQQGCACLSAIYSFVARCFRGIFWGIWTGICGDVWEVFECTLKGIWKIDWRYLVGISWVKTYEKKYFGRRKSAFNIRVVSGRVASPGEVLVVVLVVLVVAF